MAAQLLLLLSCLIAVASPAAINLVTSLGDDEDLNLMKSVDLEDHAFKMDADDLALMTGEEKSYVDTSVFRESSPPSAADSVKVKPSLLFKKVTSDVFKHAKHEHNVKKALSVKLEPPVLEEKHENEVKKALSVKLEPPVLEEKHENEVKKALSVKLEPPVLEEKHENEVKKALSVKLEPPVLEEKHENEVKKALSVKLEPPVLEEKPSEVDDEFVLEAMRKLIEVAGKSIVVSLTSETTTTGGESVDLTTTTTATPPSTNEDAELPRLSPPIWSHSSQAEILADPLRLPLVETYDRYDRYSHSIARDVVW